MGEYMAKIAISLPDDIFQAVEKERLARGQSRSKFFRHAVEEHLRRQRERELEEQYVRGYLENPETPEELEWIFAAGLEALAENPWEDGEDK
ncbi:MAG: hypothetical protein BZY88_17970 [SAR202 cluster bacterium Io17-Chloro-G9]|nr:MAG: hypothetical protein BZY88_17970 [SAR202 cluster bacterium Io17-Chloro-G9]